MKLQHQRFNVIQDITLKKWFSFTWSKHYNTVLATDLIFHLCSSQFNTRIFPLQMGHPQFTKILSHFPFPHIFQIPHRCCGYTFSQPNSSRRRGINLSKQNIRVRILVSRQQHKQTSSSGSQTGKARLLPHMDSWF